MRSTENHLILPAFSPRRRCLQGRYATSNGVRENVCSRFRALARRKPERARQIAAANKSVGVLVPPALADDGWHRDAVLISAVRAPDGDIPPRQPPSRIRCGNHRAIFGNRISRRIATTMMMI
jgi:hypothetical protein